MQSAARGVNTHHSGTVAAIQHQIWRPTPRRGMPPLRCLPGMPPYVQNTGVPIPFDGHHDSRTTERGDFMGQQYDSSGQSYVYGYARSGAPGYVSNGNVAPQQPYDASYKRRREEPPDTHYQQARPAPYFRNEAYSGPRPLIDHQNHGGNRPDFGQQPRMARGYSTTTSTTYDGGQWESGFGPYQRPVSYHRQHSARQKPTDRRRPIGQKPKCQDCGKLNPKFYLAGQKNKRLCGDCAPPGASKRRTAKEIIEREDRSKIFMWARELEPMRCAYWVVGKCPDLRAGQISCRRIHE